MRTYARTRGEQFNDIRKWGRLFTRLIRAEEIGAMPIVYRHMRKVVYRVLGIRMGKTMMQMPIDWRDRLKAAGLDEEWNVLDRVLWEHAVWQVETTGVFRPERQAGLHELLGDQEAKPRTPKNVPRGTKDAPQSTGEISLSETIARALKR